MTENNQPLTLEPNTNGNPENATTKRLSASEFATIEDGRISFHVEGNNENARYFTYKEEPFHPTAVGEALKMRPSKEHISPTKLILETDLVLEIDENSHKTYKMEIRNDNLKENRVSELSIKELNGEGKIVKIIVDRKDLDRTDKAYRGTEAGEFDVKLEFANTESAAHSDLKDLRQQAETNIEGLQKAVIQADADITTSTGPDLEAAIASKKAAEQLVIEAIEQKKILQADLDQVAVDRQALSENQEVSELENLSMIADALTIWHNNLRDEISALERKDGSINPLQTETYQNRLNLVTNLIGIVKAPSQLTAGELDLVQPLKESPLPIPQERGARDNPRGGLLESGDLLIPEDQDITKVNRIKDGETPLLEPGDVKSVEKETPEMETDLQILLNVVVGLREETAQLRTQMKEKTHENVGREGDMRELDIKMEGLSERNTEIETDLSVIQSVEDAIENGAIIYAVDDNGELTENSLTFVQLQELDPETLMAVLEQNIEILKGDEDGIETFLQLSELFDLVVQYHESKDEGYDWKNRGILSSLRGELRTDLASNTHNIEQLESEKGALAEEILQTLLIIRELNNHELSYERDISEHLTAALAIADELFAKGETDKASKALTIILNEDPEKKEDPADNPVVELEKTEVKLEQAESKEAKVTAESALTEIKLRLEQTPETEKGWKNWGKKALRAAGAFFAGAGVRAVTKTAVTALIGGAAIAAGPVGWLAAAVVGGISGAAAGGLISGQLSFNVFKKDITHAPYAEYARYLTKEYTGVSALINKADIQAAREIDALIKTPERVKVVAEYYNRLIKGEISAADMTPEQVKELKDIIINMTVLEQATDYLGFNARSEFEGLFQDAEGNSIDPETALHSFGKKLEVLAGQAVDEEHLTVADITTAQTAAKALAVQYRSKSVRRASWAKVKRGAMWGAAGGVVGHWMSGVSGGVNEILENADVSSQIEAIELSTAADQMSLIKSSIPGLSAEQLEDITAIIGADGNPTISPGEWNAVTDYLGEQLGTSIDAIDTEALSGLFGSEGRISSELAAAWTPKIHEIGRGHNFAGASYSEFASVGGHQHALHDAMNFVDTFIPEDKLTDPDVGAVVSKIYGAVLANPSMSQDEMMDMLTTFDAAESRVDFSDLFTGGGLSGPTGPGGLPFVLPDELTDGIMGYQRVYGDSVRSLFEKITSGDAPEQVWTATQKALGGLGLGAVLVGEALIYDPISSNAATPTATATQTTTSSDGKKSDEESDKEDEGSNEKGGKEKVKRTSSTKISTKKGKGPEEEPADITSRISTSRGENTTEEEQALQHITSDHSGKIPVELNHQIEGSNIDVANITKYIKPKEGWVRRKNWNVPSTRINGMSNSQHQTAAFNELANAAASSYELAKVSDKMNSVDGITATLPKTLVDRNRMELELSLEEWTIKDLDVLIKASDKVIIDTFEKLLTASKLPGATGLPKLVKGDLFNHLPLALKQLKEGRAVVSYGTTRDMVMLTSAFSDPSKTQAELQKITDDFFEETDKFFKGRSPTMRGPLSNEQSRSTSSYAQSILYQESGFAPDDAIYRLAAYDAAIRAAKIEVDLDAEGKVEITKMPDDGLATNLVQQVFTVGQVQAIKRAANPTVHAINKIIEMSKNATSTPPTPPAAGPPPTAPGATTPPTEAPEQVPSQVRKARVGNTNNGGVIDLEYNKDSMNLDVVVTETDGVVTRNSHVQVTNQATLPQDILDGIAGQNATRAIQLQDALASLNNPSITSTVDTAQQPSEGNKIEEEPDELSKEERIEAVMLALPRIAELDDNISEKQFELLTEIFANEQLSTGQELESIEVIRLIVKSQYASHDLLTLLAEDWFPTDLPENHTKEEARTAINEELSLIHTEVSGKLQRSQEEVPVYPLEIETPEELDIEFLKARDRTAILDHFSNLISLNHEPLAPQYEQQLVEGQRIIINIFNGNPIGLEIATKTHKVNMEAVLNRVSDAKQELGFEENALGILKAINRIIEGETPSLDVFEAYELAIQNKLDILVPDSISITDTSDISEVDVRSIAERYEAVVKPVLTELFELEDPKAAEAARNSLNILNQIKGGTLTEISERQGEYLLTTLKSIEHLYAYSIDLEARKKGVILLSTLHELLGKEPPPKNLMKDHTMEGILAIAALVKNAINKDTTAPQPPELTGLDPDSDLLSEIEDDWWGDNEKDDE